MPLPNESRDKSRLPVIAVLGAAGLSGTYLLARLRQANLRVRAVVHSMSGAERAIGAGADETAQADLADRSTVYASLAGAQAVYMIPPAFHPDEYALAINALQAAEQIGAKRFVYVSVMHPHTPSLAHHMRKAAAEAVIRQSQIPWTILQPSMYAQMVCLTFGSAPPGTVRIPFNNSLPFSVIDLRDLSEVGLKVLTEEGHAWATYELSGDQLTMTEMVRIAGRARGVELQPIRIPPSAAPVPPSYAKNPTSAADFRAMLEEYDHCGFRGNSNVLKLLLGRNPTSFEDVAFSMIKKS